MIKHLYRNASAPHIITWRVFYEGTSTMKKVRILSIGVNQMGDSEGTIPGVHAEYDAIQKLPPLNNKKRLKEINILITRFSSKNKTQSSKPCYNCIQKMKWIAPKRGYKIHDICYSDGNGNIVKTNLNYLERDELHYSSGYLYNKSKTKMNS